MWTITEDDGSMVSAHHSPTSLKQMPEVSFESHEIKPKSTTDRELMGNPISPEFDQHFEEEFGGQMDYSQSSFNFFPESPAPSPIVHESPREVFRSELHPTISRRPQSANIRANHNNSDKRSSNSNPQVTRPSSANNVPMSLPPTLAEKGRSSSFGRKDTPSEAVYTPLNDLSEQRRDLDQLPRSERLVRRMGSPLGITLLQLDERDMLLGRDESWYLSNDGRVRSRRDMEVPRHMRKRDRDFRKDPGTTKPIMSQRPLTGKPRGPIPQPGRVRRPLSASPRVQRSDGWQDGSYDRRVEWTESEVSGILDEDDEEECGWLDDDSEVRWRHQDKANKQLRKRNNMLASRVMELGNDLRIELRKITLAEVWDQILDPSRKGYFGLPELVQALSWSNVSCSLLEAEELLGLIAQKRGGSRVSLKQFQQFYRATEGRVAQEIPAKQGSSTMPQSDLQSLLESLELRARKLKLPSDNTQDNKHAIPSAQVRTSKGAKSIVLI